MNAKFWLVVALLGWVAIALIGSIVNQFVETSSLAWTGIQQIWLIIVGGLGVYRLGIVRWNGREVILGAAAGVGLFIVNIIVGALIIRILSVIFTESTVADWLARERVTIEILLDLKAENKLWLSFMIVTLGAPISEEILFRGLLLQTLRKYLSPWVGVVLSALLFALIHLYVIQFLPVFLSGLILGALFLLNNNLVRPIIAHSVVNGLVFSFHFLL